MAVSLYRKYRPQTFEEVVGQEHVEKTLMNAVGSGRPSHAYLFCGPRGTGKTTTARLFAKALLCEKSPTSKPDGSCSQCLEIADGTHPDVYELDAASRTGVDNIREEIISRVKFAPTRGAYKIYIIDEVHMLSAAAFNALLLTIEEPPSHIVFILCTTEAHKVPSTIVSRCQRFDFRRLNETQIAGRLAVICEKEGFDVAPGALELIAARSQGGMRDAISALEQVAVFSGGRIGFDAVEDLLGVVTLAQLFSLADLVASRDVAACFSWVAAFAQGATDITLFANEFAGHIRNLYAIAAIEDSAELEHVLNCDEDTLGRYRVQARRFGSVDRLAHVLAVLGDLSMELKSAPNARLALEIALTRMTRPSGDLTIEALAARVAALEQQAASLPIVGSPEATTEKATGNARPMTKEVAGGAGTHRLWLQTEAAVKKQSRLLGSMLSGAEVRIEADSEQLTIVLPGDAGFSKMKLEDPANTATIAGVIAEVFGKRYQPVFVLGKETTTPRGPVQSYPPGYLQETRQELRRQALQELQLQQEPQQEYQQELQQDSQQGFQQALLLQPEPRQKPLPQPEPRQKPLPQPEPRQEHLLQPEPRQKPLPQPEPRQETQQDIQQDKALIEQMLSASLGSTITLEEI